MIACHLTFSPVNALPRENSKLNLNLVGTGHEESRRAPATQSEGGAARCHQAVEEEEEERRAATRSQELRHDPKRQGVWGAE